MQDIVADQLRQTVAVLTNVAKDNELHAVLVECGAGNGEVPQGRP